MQSLGIAGTDYMRTRGAARAGAAPRALDPAASPTLNVGATHGRGSEPIAGPQQVQHHPLQQPTARQTAHRASLNAIFASPFTRDGSPGVRSSRTALNSQRLTPSQQSFVDHVESKMRLEAGLESRATTGSGDAGAHPSSPAEGNEHEGSPEHASPGRPQPPAESQPRSELEELRYRLAEQEEQLAWMNEKLSRVSPGPLAPAGQQGGYELTVYQPKSKGISLETGKQGFSHPAPPSGHRPPPPQPSAAS